MGNGISNWAGSRAGVPGHVSLCPGPPFLRTVMLNYRYPSSDLKNTANHMLLFWAMLCTWDQSHFCKNERKKERRVTSTCPRHQLHAGHQAKAFTVTLFNLPNNLPGRCRGGHGGSEWQSPLLRLACPTLNPVFLHPQPARKAPGSDAHWVNCTLF